MSGDRPSAVKVLDIRDGGADLSFLDKLNRASAHRLGLTARVVVVDNTQSLLDNHLRFQRLVSLHHVRAVICVAVGPIDVGGEISLRQSSAFRAAGVTLWVGDEWGSTWAGGGARPEPIVDGTPALPLLVAALGSPQVFDEVYETVRRVPYQAACPGLDVVRPRTGGADLDAVRATLLEELAQRSRSAGPVAGVPGPARARSPLDPVRDVVTAGSDLDVGRRALRDAVAAMADQAAATAATTGLVRAGGAVDTDRLRRAAAGHFGALDRMLNLMDRESAGQDAGADLRRLGVPAADPPDHPRLAGLMAGLVREELGRGRSLRDLSTALRRVSNRSMIRDTDVVRAELASLREVFEARPAAAPRRVWAVPAAIGSAVAALLAAGAAWASASVVAGGVAALLWSALLALFLFHLPGTGSATGTRAGLLGVGTVAVAAAAYGGWTGATAEVVPAPGAAAAAAAGLVVLTAVLWCRAATAWLVALGLPDLDRALGRAEAITTERVADHVRSLEHRRRLSDAALLLASDGNALADFYLARAAERRAGGQGRTAEIPAELRAVLRGDLVSLVLRALDEHLRAIGSAAVLAADPSGVTTKAARDLAAYEAFVAGHGVYDRPPMIEDDGFRAELNQGFWQSSDAAKRILRSDGRAELTQLCQVGDIHALDVSWDHVQVLRFAPAPAQRVLLEAGSGADVVTTNLDMAGVLRLVPLGAGRVTHEYPATADGPDEQEHAR
ncbi:hypothetical protein SAMN04489727_3130 [Amycolatopsis tolypomycina]|uniref:Uncharacterized protein n=1 Tax=Amycolatopsis tolypomycina TaxID=208445 RepID=A0A1H4R2G7_9PSEU|nr:hypothetical protein [Amycolatopsis tolypomycina]SEC26055.1 hypothetical protein SAMN04489727_3130 [Amycolatopsis tolypomycina]